MIKSWTFDDCVTLFLHDETDATDLPSNWHNFASPGERVRASQMGAPKRAHTFLRTRALLRQKLAEILNAGPPNIPIEITPEGKPRLPAAHNIAFSLSHAHGLILIAVARDIESVGVDIELMDPATDIEKIAERMLPAEQQTQLASAPPGKRRALAFQFWCLKEARHKCGPAANREQTALLENNFACAVTYAARE